MGAFDKMFGIGLVVLGITIAFYWTAWLCLSLVITPLFLITHCFIALLRRVVLSIQLVLLGTSLVIQIASSRINGWHHIDWVVHTQD